MTSTPATPLVQFVVTLALASMLGLLSGCSSSKHALTLEQQAQADAAAYEAEVRKVVPDPARADQLLTLTAEFQKLVDEAVLTTRSYRENLAALNANYAATRSDYVALFKQHDARREVFLKKALTLRAQEVALITESEWEQLKKVRLRAVDASLRAL